MPTYCYSDGNGNLFEAFFKFGEAPRQIRRVIRGIRFTLKRDFQAEQVGVPPKKGWPMSECYASGVHADQAQELRDHFKKHGLNIQVTKDGNPIYESPSQRKKALACRGMHDRASFT